MTRIFVYDGRQFPDPDSRLSVEEVRQQLAVFFPELTNADTREERRGEDAIYTFSKRIGSKGAQGLDLVGLLRRLPEKRLRLFDLAAELTTPQGELDVEGAARRRPEIDLAVAEAETYAQATRRALQALRPLRR